MIKKKLLTSILLVKENLTVALIIDSQKVCLQTDQKVIHFCRESNCIETPGSDDLDKKHIISAPVETKDLKESSEFIKQELPLLECSNNNSTFFLDSSHLEKSVNYTTNTRLHNQIEYKTKHFQKEDEYFTNPKTKKNLLQYSYDRDSADINDSFFGPKYRFNRPKIPETNTYIDQRKDEINQTKIIKKHTVNNKWKYSQTKLSQSPSISKSNKPNQIQTKMQNQKKSLRCKLPVSTQKSKINPSQIVEVKADETEIHLNKKATSDLSEHESNHSITKKKDHQENNNPQTHPINSNSGITISCIDSENLAESNSSEEIVDSSTQGPIQYILHTFFNGLFKAHKPLYWSKVILSKHKMTFRKRIKRVNLLTNQLSSFKREISAIAKKFNILLFQNHKNIDFLFSGRMTLRYSTRKEMKQYSPLNFESVDYLKWFDLSLRNTIVEEAFFDSIKNQKFLLDLITNFCKMHLSGIDHKQDLIVSKRLARFEEINVFVICGIIMYLVSESLEPGHILLVYRFMCFFLNYLWIEFQKPLELKIMERIVCMRWSCKEFDWTKEDFTRLFVRSLRFYVSANKPDPRLGSMYPLVESFISQIFSACYPLFYCLIGTTEESK